MHRKECDLHIVNKHIAANDKYVFSESETLYKLEKALLVAELLSKKTNLHREHRPRVCAKKELDSFGACFFKSLKK